MSKADEVVVPREPTEEMINSICSAHTECKWPDDFGNTARAIRRVQARRGYKAALASAPAERDAESAGGLTVDQIDDKAPTDLPNALLYLSQALLRMNYHNSKGDSDLLQVAANALTRSYIINQDRQDYAVKLERQLDALARRAVSAQEPVYVIFDGPPSHESGRFVEVETENGKSVSVGKWENYSGKYWRLGPLYAKPTDSGSVG